MWCKSSFITSAVAVTLAAASGGTVSADQDLLVGDWENDRIERYDGNTGAFVEEFVESGVGGLNAPQTLIFGPDGNFYVASSHSGQVLRYDGSTGDFIDSFTDPDDDGGMGDTDGLAFGPDGNLYVSAPNNDAVYRFDGQTGEFIDVFVEPGSGGLDRPTSMVFGPNEHLYVSTENSIMRFNGATGEFIDVFVEPESGGLGRPHGLVFTALHNLLVADFLTPNGDGGTRVLLYDGKTGAFLGPFADENLTRPAGLAFGPDGNLYVNSRKPGRVVRFDGATGAFIDIFVPSIGANTTSLVFHDLPAACFADLNDDGSVGVSDLLILLGFWGRCSPLCLGDFDGDGNVGASDLLILLANWGPCP